MKTILIHNTKGGVGKTTITKAVAEILAKMDKKVLIIDLDGQGSITDKFHVNNTASYSRQWLVRQPKDKINEFVEEFLPKTIEKTQNPNIDVVSGGRDLNDYLDTFRRQIAPEKVLGLNILLFKRAFPYKYDYIFIDLNPAWDILTINSYLAADEIISIIDRTEDALKNLIKNLKDWEQWSQDYEVENKLKHILLNRIKNDKMSKEIIKTINQEKVLKMIKLDTFIPESAMIEKSVVSGGLSVVDVKSLKNWKPSNALAKWLSENSIRFEEGNPFFNLVNELFLKGVL